ncbi:MAG: hypothetical protein ABIE23_00540 [archaeon]
MGLIKRAVTALTIIGVVYVGLAFFHIQGIYLVKETFFAVPTVIVFFLYIFGDIYFVTFK